MFNQEQHICQSLLQQSQCSYLYLNKIKSFSKNISQLEYNLNRQLSISNQKKKLPYRNRYKKAPLLLNAAKETIQNQQRHDRKMFDCQNSESKQIITIKAINIKSSPKERYSKQIKTQGSNFRQISKSRQEILQCFSPRSFFVNEQYQKIRLIQLDQKYKSVSRIQREKFVQKETNTTDKLKRQKPKCVNVRSNQMKHNQGQTYVQCDKKGLLKSFSKGHEIDSFQIKLRCSKRFLTLKKDKQGSNQTKKKTISTLRMLTLMRKRTHQKQKDIKQYQFFSKKKFIVAVKPTCQVLQFIHKFDK